MANSETTHFKLASAAHRRRGGFTLIEIIVVLAIIVALSLLAWPAVENMLIGSQLPESAGRVRSLLAMARSGAVGESRRVRVRFLPNVQQPIVEIERDPVFNPGVYELVMADWTAEPVLLGDVQVAAVSLGRPEFLKAVSKNVDPRTDAGEAATDGANAADIGNVQDTGEALALRTAVEDEQVDLFRPTIVFEPDGSTDWAMIAVARSLPGEELTDDTEQRWVIVDGRTGMITIRAALSSAELTDPATYVDREKLALPELAELTDSPLSFSGPGMGMPDPDAGLEGLGGADLFGGGGGGMASGGGFASGAGDGKVKESGGQFDNRSERGSGRSAPGGQMGDLRPSRQGRGDQGAGSKSQRNPADTAANLDEKLSNSDLTDEEKKNIKDTLGTGGRRGGR